MIVPVALGIDLGTSAVKAGLVAQDGELVGVGRVEYELDTPTPDWVECSPQVYWDATCSAVRQAVAAANRTVTPEVTGISFSSQGETMLCLDEADRPLRPAIVWLDNRSGDEAAEIGAEFDPDELYAHTGQIECVATWPATKLLWLARHEPEVFRAARRFALLEDWFMLRMSGTLAAEPSLHTTSLLLDIQRLAWWRPMLDALGLNEARLPTIVQPGAAVGRLREQAATDLGLPAGIPVVAGCIDIVAATLGAGNVVPGHVTEQTGTILAVATLLNALPPRSARLPIYLHAIPETFCANPYAQTAALVLRWVRDNLFGLPGSQTDTSLIPYETVIAEADWVPAGSDGLLLLPHLAGAYYPEFDLRAKGAFVGLTLAHRRAHMVRASLEAVAYMLRAALTGLRVADVEFASVTSLGKPAQSRTWTQIKADVCQLPMRRLAEPEVAIVGAGMLVHVATGRFATIADAAASMSRELDVLEPQPGCATVYDEMFERYRAVYASLAPYFQAHKP